MPGKSSRPAYKSKFSGFHDLMKFRVREILLVSSLYDAFVLEEDGRLAEKIFSEYIDLNLHFVPRITKVASAEEALQSLQHKTFDLVITMTRIADMNPVEFGKKVKQLDPDKIVVLLTYEHLDPNLLKRIREVKSIDKVFYWSGESKLMLSIIKYVEDLKNVLDDTAQGVQVILLVEDSPKYYSLFLPGIYTEIMLQTRNLVADGVNPLHRLLRMRARPKILLAESFEEAQNILETFRHNLLGIITDLKFPRGGMLQKDSGFQLAEIAKKAIPDLPILVQSSEGDWKGEINQRLAKFLNKNSPNLLLELRSFIVQYFGFGDFVFRYPDGREICRAKDLTEFSQRILEIPTESLEYHAHRNHFSIWLRARTEFTLADEIRPKKVSDFRNIEDLRQYIYQAIQNLLLGRQHGIIKDFTTSLFYADSTFIRLGSGSLGGKGRGIAFINALLAESQILEKYKSAEVKTPQTFVIGTEVFEEFMEVNQLQEFAIQTQEVEEINKKFLQAELPEDIIRQLHTLLQRVNYPLAVRSSSLLEDSQLLPFAGMYKTFMLANTHSDIEVRLKELLDAIRLIYASIYYRAPKEYVQNTDYRIEEEKMAVIIQQCTGIRYGNRYYPTISGVAQSYNYYPIEPMKPEEGIVHLALGLGKIIMDGERIYRFSPKHPSMNLPYGSALEYCENSQSNFLALHLSQADQIISGDENFSLRKYDLTQAEEDGTLFFVGSTFSPQDQMIQDTLAIEGPRVVTFANILKYHIFPLTDILNELLSLGQRAFGTHVEIEFSVNLSRHKRKSEFFVLQIRPMVAGAEAFEVAINPTDREKAICYTNHAVGNGVYENIRDIIYVDPANFDMAKSDQIALELEVLNHHFIEHNLHYILIGFGRWGTADPWLGIPVNWYQVSRARIIIESQLNDLKVEPSLGSHFFHNLISLQLGYFYIKGHPHPDLIDWKWLQGRKPYRSTRFLRQVHFDQPLSIKIDGKAGQGIISLPNKKP
ncbi:MAG: phosphoenolpyruvate synthase [Caldithrix sp. RBG_13_44_9]|nr:MAG: phosphoenolpyruvate synthase [Caldithrix sp. RBG_13_44_9]